MLAVLDVPETVPPSTDQVYTAVFAGSRFRAVPDSGYAVSQKKRKRIEECFGWSKDGRPLRKMKLYGKRKVEFLTTLTVGIYTLLRVTNLLGPPALAPE